MTLKDFLPNLSGQDAGRLSRLAIDPTKPPTPITPLVPTSAALPDAKAAQAAARLAVSDATSRLGAMIGSAATPSAVSGVTKALEGQSVEGPAVIEQMVEAAIQKTVQQAVPRQAPLGPVIANLGAALERTDVPQPVKQAAQAVLDRTVPVDKPIDATVVRTAMRESGVFMEARLARPASEPSAAPNAPQGQAPTPTDMKAALLVFRAVVSTWLAKTGGTTSREPSARSQGDASTDAPRREGGPAPSPARVTRYGPSLVARAASAPSSRPEGQGAPPGALGSPVALSSTASAPAPTPGQPPQVAPGLEDAVPLDAVATPLGDQEDAESPPPPPLAQTRPQIQPEKPQSPRIFLPVGLIEDDDLPALPALATPEVDAPEVPVTQKARTEALKPPPPYPGGALSAQPPITANLGEGLPAEALARHLLREADGALARQELLQVASLARRPEEGDRAGEARTARWNFEVPFQTPHGYSVAQFEVSRDGGGGGGAAGGEVEKTWRVRFSLDVEPLGPVHAHLSLTGVNTRVSLWAERPETMERLRAGEETLGAALRQVDLSPELAFHTGAPTVAPLATGRFVDQAS